MKSSDPATSMTARINQIQGEIVEEQQKTRISMNHMTHSTCSLMQLPCHFKEADFPVVQYRKLALLLKLIYNVP